MKVKVKIENRSNFDLPAYATSGSSGLDVRANLGAGKQLEMLAGQTVAIPTGLFFEIPEGYEIQVRPRSGLSYKTNLRVANSPGTIDCITNNCTIKTDKGDMTPTEVINHPNVNVLSYDIENNKQEFKKLLGAWEVGEKECLRISFDDGTFLECTKTQLIMTENGWKHADVLTLNDKMY